MNRFLVTARDALDVGAYDRRMAAREAHLAALERLKAEGKVLFALATLGGDGRPNGSVVVFSCVDRGELDRLLAAEPYVIDHVWDQVTVEPCRLAPMFDS